MTATHRSQPAQVLLLGGGHANLQVLHQLAKLSARDVAVTLISDVQRAPYSGMLPSYMAGVYKAEEMHFDLPAICQRFGFRFVHDSVQRIQAAENKVVTAQGQDISYDFCSINLGILPTPLAAGHARSRTQDLAGDLAGRFAVDLNVGPTDDPTVIYVKPISRLIEKWESLLTRVQRQGGKVDLTVIGGGAGAFELAVACRRRLSSSIATVRIITGLKGLLHEFSPNVQNQARQSLARLQIEILDGVRVENVETDGLRLSDHTRLARQFCFVGTSAKAPGIFKASNLPVNKDGFLQVDRFLQVEGFQNLFAAGDCIDFTPSPLPKAGVYAVRQGPVLAANLERRVRGQTKLQTFTPQRSFLTILTTGPGTAIATKYGLSLNGQFAWRLKDYIDRQFMKRFS